MRPCVGFGAGLVDLATATKPARTSSSRLIKWPIIMRLPAISAVMDVDGFGARHGQPRRTRCGRVLLPQRLAMVGHAIVTG